MSYVLTPKMLVVSAMISKEADTGFQGLSHNRHSPIDPYYPKDPRWISAKLLTEIDKERSEAIGSSVSVLLPRQERAS